MKSPRNIARRFFGLTLALAGLTTVTTLVLGPVALAQVTTPSWTFTGSPNMSPGPTATLLPNGKVLVAGGGGDGTAAELYDPATGTWSVTGGLNVGGNGATLLQNGKVLVAGAKTAELYDPATGAWSLTGSLNTARGGYTATLLQNGKVLIVGGEDESCTPLNTAELYDPETGMWSVTGNLKASFGRLGHTATLLQNGKVLVAGGTEIDDDCAGGEAYGLVSTELYDPSTGSWSFTGSLNTGRFFHTATLLPNGNVLVVGGQGENQFGFTNVFNSAELYDPATGTWSYAANQSRGEGHTATLLPNGQVLVAGGLNCGDYNQPDNNFGHCGIAVNGEEIYDPATGNWSATASLNTPRSGHTATLLFNGKVLVVGGRNEFGGSILPSAELYDPGTSSTPNQIDDAQFFVHQHYLDFLNREPDPDGLAFWTNEISSCGGDAQCIEVKRINDSAAFYLSIEFQQTGYLVYRFYKASYGNLPNAPVPIKLSEFLPDTKEIGQGVIVNQSGWEQVLENNKQAFSAEFVQRSRFTSAYPTSMTPAEFVDTLFANAGVTPLANERSAAINEFGGAINTIDTAARARALRDVSENSTLNQQEFNRAFVLMQYFGYLRRNPNDAPEPTLDYQGYNFWLNKLNSFNGNYVNAEMVKAFINAGEYRQRFGL